MSWQEELNEKRLKTRGWYGCIAPDGWRWIIEDLDAQLAYLDPDYEIQQVKEKFGTLRYYYEPTKGGVVQELMDAAISRAEYLSARTCDVCGNSSAMGDSKRGIKYDSTAVVKVRGGWYKTICDTCDKDSSYSSQERLNAVDQIEDLKLYIKWTREKLEEGQDPLDLLLVTAEKDILENL